MATKVTSSLITTISASQIQAGGATTGQVLTYNGSTSTWVASAASAGSGFSASLSSIGYQRLPSGLIMQWGKDSTAALSDGAERVITFPIPFTTACFQVLVSPENSDGSSSRDLIPQVKTITTTNVVIYNNAAGVWGLSNVPTIWFAIGV